VQRAIDTGVNGVVMEIPSSKHMVELAYRWPMEKAVETSIEATKFAHANGLEVVFFPIDFSRAEMKWALDLIERVAKEGHMDALALVDTFGVVSPHAMKYFVRQVKARINKRLEAHFHQDFGMGVANTIMALAEGVEVMHTTVLGIGERSGNTPMDLLLVNLVMMGYINRDLTTLPKYCDAVARACDVPIPRNYPVVGADAFRTATCVHAAALVKAFRKNDRALMDAVYAAVPASLVGREQEIEIGPMSGRSNVIYWLERRGLAATDEIVDRIFAAAKSSTRTLTFEQIDKIVNS
jgi:isopropylmalate/homocitrate/citramalate synthase